ncbi:MAG: UDP-N-acetylmuramoyl-L-alanine--D-glutamate ligase [Planctomycetota bacterium]|jgi:UDP-N-acetylmuramoylalanine--D-glutamate ligase
MPATATAHYRPRPAPLSDLSPKALAGKRILVWGAGSHGGGLASARYCHQAGARVAILDSQPPAANPSVAAHAAAAGWPWFVGQDHHPALRRADLVIVSPAIPPRVLAARDADLPPLASAEALACAVHHGPRILVTGTKGKSTTAAILSTLIDWPLAGNSNQPLLDAITTYGPSSPLVCELSSFQLWHLAAWQPRFTIGVLTNLGIDHLDWHPSAGHYQTSKLTALTWCDHVIGRHDALAHTIEPATVTSAGFITHAGAILAPRDALGLPGRHNANNAALALSVANHLGLDPAVSAIRLHQVQPLPHRLATVAVREQRRFINDSAATTLSATCAALDAIDGEVAVLIGGVAKADHSAELAAALRARGAHVYCFGHYGRELAAQLAGQGLPCPHYPQLRAAVTAADRCLGPAGTVLLSPCGASGRDYADYVARGLAFAAIAHDLSLLSPPPA